MENNRTKIEILIHEFILSDLSIDKFIENYLFDVYSNENKKGFSDNLKKAFKVGLVSKAFNNFYDENLSSIKIDELKLNLEYSNQSEKLNDIQNLQIEALEKKEFEFKRLKDGLLDKILTSFEKNINVYNEVKGFNYFNKFPNSLEKENLLNFLSELKKLNFIEPISNDEFLKFFSSSFIPNKEKIIWKASLNRLYFLIQKLIESEVSFNEKYRDSLPYIFKWNDKKKAKKIIDLQKERLSSNNKPKLKTYDDDVLDNLVNQLL